LFPVFLKSLLKNNIIEDVLENELITNDNYGLICSRYQCHISDQIKIIFSHSFLNVWPFIDFNSKTKSLIVRLFNIKIYLRVGGGVVVVVCTICPFNVVDKMFNVDGETKSTESQTTPAPSSSLQSSSSSWGQSTMDCSSPRHLTLSIENGGPGTDPKNDSVVKLRARLNPSSLQTTLA